MPSLLPNDDLITETYILLDIPSDTLVRTPRYLDAFVRLLPERHRPVESEELARRIITLRKNGSLPRLRRKPK
jgi:hypothetical protein